MKRFFVTAAALLAALSLDAQTSDKEVKTPYDTPYMTSMEA